MGGGYVTTGCTAVARVRLHQSKLGRESRPTRCFWVPYFNFCRSAYVKYELAVLFFACLDIFCRINS